MKCPFCDALEDKVVDSRMAKEGELIRRRRECLGCKRRYTTYERVEETLPLVVKKDGRREPFDRGKIIAGLKRACEKRPISMATIEAVAEDPVTARLLGVNTDRLIVLTFFVSSFLGGLAGTLVGLSVGIAGPYFGIAFGLKGLAVIVLGGLGNIPGTVLGGLLVGLAESFVPSQHVAYRDAVPFVLLLVVLLVRPHGLLGQAGPDRA